MEKEGRPPRIGKRTFFGRDGGARAARPGEELGFSRRSFLEFSTLTAAEAAALGLARVITSESAMAQDANSATQPAEVVPVTLGVNGVEHNLRLEPRATLAEVLRGPLGLTGVKIACNHGACSACTVWLDGAPVCSCMTLAVDVGARKVTTIEGLADGEALHAVQAAFIAHDAVQCGFCTPGMVMSCAALLARNPNPSAEDVERAISGHLCRCGTYPHVVAATLAAAEMRKG
jgi:aerobic-type carbon monoxide dehydrogenase small subunit (CoxS/CutS family)